MTTQYTTGVGGSIETPGQRWFQLKLQTWQLALQGMPANTPFSDRLMMASDLFDWALNGIDIRGEIGLEGETPFGG